MKPQSEVEARWREFVRSGSPCLRELLIRDYTFLARTCVERLRISPWGCVGTEDLHSHAMIGLIDAIDRYDPDQGVPFEAFAPPRIRGTVLDALRRLDWVPRSVRQKESRLQEAHRRLEARLGRSPSEAELAEELGIDVEQVARVTSAIARSGVHSLEERVSAREDGATLGEVVPAAGPDPYQLQERRAAENSLSEALGTLSERERTVVSLYYYHELTLKEIGLSLNVSMQRAAQIHTRAVDRLRHRLVRHRDLVSGLAVQ